MREFEPWLGRWPLAPDGEVLVTPTSRLLPVVVDAQPAMLKVATHTEEARGASVMEWWAGDGAARVLARDGEAVLLERATGPRSLVDMAREADDNASRIICEVAARLHAPRSTDPPRDLVPLAEWFRDLWPAAERLGGILRVSASAAQALLADPQEATVLHGDLHHGNVLDFGERGWMAIDPKGLIGERGYDFANLFNNPDRTIATQPGRLARQASIVAGAAGLDRRRLLLWIVAYSGLSAAWSMEDGLDPTLALAVAEIAAKEAGEDLFSY
jgi:streptomycin 6-kinase